MTDRSFLDRELQYAALVHTGPIRLPPRGLKRKTKPPARTRRGPKAAGGKLKMVTKPFRRRQGSINHTITAGNSVSRNQAK